MNKCLLLLVAFFYFNFVACQSNINEIKDKKSSGIEIFSFKNDTIDQSVEIMKINKDTLKVKFKTTDLKGKISCSLEGIAVRDTIGDFLNEEETVEDENGKVFSVTNYLFFDNDSINTMVVQLDRKNRNKLLYYKIDSVSIKVKPNCLYYSVGTLRKNNTQ